MPTLENTLPTKKTRIAVAMSGGVDSNMVAYLLAKAGHEVVGFTAWTLNGPGKCCNDALVSAGRVCESLNIPYDTVDLRAEFSHYVMDYYNDSYTAGLTPNPCVECNQYVKWEKLVVYAREKLDVEYVATGHYAQIDRSGPQIKVFRSIDETKDQTYMMSRVLKRDFEHALFPLGHMTKKDVVQMARSVEMPEADGKESQDICFVLDGHANYMKGLQGSRPGDIIDMDTGETLGQHEGCFGFTIGQRKGVKVSANRPIYVIKIDPKTNRVYVGDKSHLETREFKVLANRWLHKEQMEQSQYPLRVMAKIRYNSPPVLATVSLESDPSTDEKILRVTLDEPLSAVTPGQICAFYDPTFTELWGGGYIEKYLRHKPFDPLSQQELPNLSCSPITS